MSNETPTIAAEVREKTGTRYAKRLRDQGRLPAVIYGHKEAPSHVSVDAKEVLRYLHHGVHVFKLEAGGKAETCLIKDLQFGYLGDNVVHIDFSRVDLNELVVVNIGLDFVGDLKESKTPGAISRHDINELEIECRVSEIPDAIRVDLSAFDSLCTVGDIDLPPGARAVADPSTTVALVTFVKAAAEGEEVEAEGDASPEVITEKKEDE